MKSSKRWSEEEDRLLATNLHKVGVAGVAELVDRSEKGVEFRARRLGLSNPPGGWPSSRATRPRAIERADAVKMFSKALRKAAARGKVMIYYHAHTRSIVSVPQSKLTQSFYKLQSEEPEMVAGLFSAHKQPREIFEAIVALARRVNRHYCGEDFIGDCTYEEYGSGCLSKPDKGSAWDLMFPLVVRLSAKEEARAWILPSSAI